MPIWQVHASTVSPSYDNLLNIMRQLSLHSHSILSTQVADLNASHPGIYYVFRNGEGEAMRVMNESTWLFIEEEQGKLMTVLQNCGVIGGVALLLLVACFLVVILPTVIAVDKSNQNIWSFFYKLPCDIVQDLRFHCEERLETTHGVDISQYSPRKSKSKALIDRSQIKCTRKWPYIARRIWIYYVLSIAYGVYFYLAVYTDLATLLLHAPELTNLTGERTLAVQSSYLWLQETVLGQGTYTHSQPFANSFYWLPRPRLETVLDRLQTTEDRIMASALGKEGADKQTEELSLAQGCTSDCPSALLARGVHPGVLSYLQDSAYFAGSKGGERDWAGEMAFLAASQQALHNSTGLLMHTYSSVLAARVQALELQIELITVLYCLLSFVFYFLVYLPLTSRVRRQLTNIWDLASLIPTDFIERIMRALKKAEANKTKPLKQ